MVKAQARNIQTYGAKAESVLDLRMQLEATAALKR